MSQPHDENRFLQGLQQRADRYDEELAAARRRQREAQLEVEYYTQIAEAARHLVEAEKKHLQGQVPDRTLFDTDSVDEALTEPDRGGDVLGIKPKRNPRYSDGTLFNAIVAVLRAADGGPMHLEDITKQVYLIERPRQLTWAKNNLVGTTARHLKAGRLLRPFANTFQLPGEREVANPATQA